MAKKATKKKVLKKKVLSKKTKPTTIGHQAVQTSFIDLLAPRLVGISLAWLRKNSSRLAQYHKILERPKVKTKPKNEAEKEKLKKALIRNLEDGFGCYRDSVRQLVNTLTGLNITAKQVNSENGNRSARYRMELPVVDFILRDGLVLKLRKKDQLAVVLDYGDGCWCLYGPKGDETKINPEEEQVDIERVVTSEEEIRTLLKTMAPRILFRIMRELVNFYL